MTVLKKIGFLFLFIISCGIPKSVYVEEVVYVEVDDYNQAFYVQPLSPGGGVTEYTLELYYRYFVDDQAKSSESDFDVDTVQYFSSIQTDALLSRLGYKQVRLKDDNTTSFIPVKNGLTGVKFVLSYDNSVDSEKIILKKFDAASEGVEIPPTADEYEIVGYYVSGETTITHDLVDSADPEVIRVIENFNSLRDPSDGDITKLFIEFVVVTRALDEQTLVEVTSFPVYLHEFDISGILS